MGTPGMEQEWPWVTDGSCGGSGGRGWAGIAGSWGEALGEAS